MKVCLILKADVQVKVMIGSYRPKADVQRPAHLPLWSVVEKRSGEAVCYAFFCFSIFNDNESF